MKHLSIQQAWKVGEVVYDQRHGVCLFVDLLYDHGLISNHTKLAMRKQLNRERRRLERTQGQSFHGHEYWLGPDTHFAREDAARLEFVTRAGRNARRAK